MSAQILDGKVLASRLKGSLKNQIDDLKKHNNALPKLVNILIGDDGGASSYSASQQKTAEEIGIVYELIKESSGLSEDKLIDLIQRLNADPKVSGIILQNPLPKQIDYFKVANTIDPLKDVEGMTVANLGRMFFDATAIIPCTAQSVVEHIVSTKIDLAGKEAVIVGRSEIVGKPLIHLLLQKNLTVSVCHSGTSKANRLQEHVKRADVLVVSIGKPNFIPGDWIKKGAIVIDVGINRLDGKVVGDVDFESAKKNAGFITPVPGGVGPVTVVTLMRNVLEAYKSLNKG